MSTLSDIALSPLSEQEKLDLAYQYSEELVARDAYTYFYSLYGVDVFKSIADSEAAHMASVKTLLDRYGLPTPLTYGELQDEFDMLKAEWEKWLKEALEVGIKIEILDIEDIIDTIKTTDNDDIKIVLTNIGGASYNHLRGFIKWLQNNRLTTTIDYSKYLSAADISTQWLLKVKLAQRLEQESVILPIQAGSQSIVVGNQKEQANKKQKNIYSTEIQKKYGKMFSKLNQQRLSNYSKNIDRTLKNINNSKSLSETTKTDRILWYTTLQEYISNISR